MPCSADRSGYGVGVNETWYDYRTVWASNAWVVVLAIGGAVMVVLGVVGTIVHSPLLYFFIPGLAVLLAHHLVVRKKIG